VSGVPRREFLGQALLLSGLSASLGTFLSGCGKAESAGGSCEANGTTASVAGSHTHALAIPKEDVSAGVEKTYALEDSGTGHTHTVTLTSASFQSLKGGTAITRTSSFDLGHDHDVRISCA
jgi:hypothetical protein